MPSTRTITNESGGPVVTAIFKRGQNIVPYTLANGESLALTRLAPLMLDQVSKGILHSRSSADPGRPGASQEPTPGNVTPVYSRHAAFTGLNWVDGKPVLRVVIDGFTEDGDQTVLTPVDGIETVVSLHARATTKGGAKIGTDGDNTLSVYVDGGGNLVIQHARADLHAVPFHIILEFTKL